MKERVLGYFKVHQSKMTGAFIVKFSTTLSFFDYAGISSAVLEFLELQTSI